MSPRSRFEPARRDDPVVRDLYADFIREADGPLDPAGRRRGGDRGRAAGEPDPPAGVLLLGRVDGDPAGLGGVRHLDTAIAEVKSMYVVPAYRGAGLGRRILDELEAIARERGCRATRLDTSEYLTAAVALYRSAGYVEVADYNGNPKADLWFDTSAVAVPAPQRAARGRSGGRRRGSRSGGGSRRCGRCRSRRRRRPARR